MKKIIASLVTLVLMAAIAIPSLAETGDNRLVVAGNAKLSLTADKATIELGAQTRGKSVSDAQKENNRIMQDVIAAVLALGVAKEDIRTSQFNVYYESGENVYSAAENLISGSYNVSNMIYITIRSLKDISAIIDSAAQAGANSIYNLTFQSSKESETYLKALERAVEDARVKAAVLAAASGKTLGDILRVEAGSYYSDFYGFQNNMGYANSETKDTAIISGDVYVNADVTVTFELK